MSTRCIEAIYGGGVLELAILGLLKEQELHGYELKKRLADTLGVVSGVSFGSLYPALARMERSGAVVTVSVAPRGARSRKSYRITEKGEELFEELLASDTASIEDSRLFHLRLAFARYLPAEARIGMLERRRAQLVERLTQSRTRARAGRRVDAYVRSLIDHDREATQHDLTWIERLIAGERSGLPAGPQSETGPPPGLQLAAPRSSGLAAPSLSGFRRPAPTHQIPGPMPQTQEEPTA
jgi:DNA-binding PadR family transcriptional regulator